MTAKPFNDNSPKPAQRVLLLGPHPDDFDAIGVTMRHLRDQGNPIYVAVVSASWSGVLDAYCGADPEQKRLAREQEQRDSVRFFGLSDDALQFLRLPEDDNGDPVDTPDNEAVIQDVVATQAPDVVFLPHGNDTNFGHQRVYAMFRRIATASPRPITAYYIRDPKTQQIRTDVYLGFDESAADWKRELLRHHTSQQHRNMTLRNAGFDDRILNVNRDIALDLGVETPYAEAFERECFNP